MQANKEILDFIIIGAQKAGTTSLFHYLRHHPEISLPAGKERPYFSHDPAYARGWMAYLEELVPKLGSTDPMRRWGTVTPQYMVGSVYESTADLALANSYDERTVPSRIYECLPRVRLIAILRDPVERALSHYRMEVGAGRERRSFDDAVAELLRADALASARRHSAPTTGYVTWGEYGRILSGYFDVFPREQILVVFTDELARAPAQLLRRVQEFIGVRADFEPDNLGARYRVGATVRPFSWKSPSSWMSPASPLSPQGVTRSLVRNPTARTVWHAISPSRQRRFGRLYQRTVHRAARRSQRPVASEAGVSSEPSSATLARLREHYAEDAGELARLLRMPAPWQALGGAG